MLETSVQFPTDPVKIPQPDGSRVPIPLKEVTHSEKKLCVWCHHVEDFGVYMKQMEKKRFIWAE